MHQLHYDVLTAISGSAIAVRAVGPVPVSDVTLASKPFGLNAASTHDTTIAS